MDFRRYKELVSVIALGKHLPDAIYVHRTALDMVPPELLAYLARCITIELVPTVLRPRGLWCDHDSPKRGLP